MAKGIKIGKEQSGKVKKAPKEAYAMREKGDGSMNYLSKVDSVASKDAAKIKRMMGGVR